MENFLRRNGLFLFLLLLAVFIVSVTVVAFAAEGATAVAVNPWWVDLLTTVLLTFGTALSGAMVMGIRKFFQWLKTKVDSEYLKGVIDRGGPVFEELADATFKDFVEPLKKEGKWNAGSKLEAKQRVKDRYKALLGADGFSKLVKILGAPDVANEWIGGMIERTVTNRKIGGRQAKVLKTTGAVAADPSRG